MAKQDKPRVVMKLKHKINYIQSSHHNSQYRNHTLTENNADLLQVTTINSTIVNIHFVSASTVQYNEIWADTNLTYKLNNIPPHTY
jgi:hypothetical protein